MANEIVLNIKVDDKGGLKIVASEAEKAAKSTDKLAKSTDRASNSKNRYNRLEKGTGQLGMNTTKGFAKQAQTVGGGLVPAYAVLAAQIFALTAAFGALKRAFAAEQLKQGLVEMGEASGLAMQSLSRGLQEATGNALSLEDSMRSVALITSAGLDPSAIEEFGEVARQASVALGRDTADSLNRLTRGITKLEPELLDELGIMVRIDEASEDYARSLGKTASELTNFEKRQAFMNAALTEAQQKFGSIEVPTSAFDRLSAALSDLSNTLVGFIASGLAPVVEFLSKSPMALVGVLVMFAGTLRTQLIGSLSDFAEKSLASAANLQKLQIGSKKFLESANRSSTSLEGLTIKMKKGTAGSKDFAAAIAGQVKSQSANLGLMRKGTISYESYEDRVRTAKLAIVQINVAESRNMQVKSKKTVATAIAAIQEGNYSKALKLTSIALLRNTRAVKVASRSFFSFSGAMATVRASMALTGTAAKIFGAALLNAIPIIGQIITVLMIAYEAFTYLREAMKSEEQKAYEAQTTKTKETLDELSKSIVQVQAAFEGKESKIKTTTQLYKSYANVLSQTSSAIRDNLSSEIAASGVGDDTLDILQEKLDAFPKLAQAVKDETGYKNLSTLAEDQYRGSTQETVKAVLQVLEVEERRANQLNALSESLKNAKKSVADYYGAFLKSSPESKVANDLHQVTLALSSVGKMQGDNAKVFKENMSQQLAGFVGAGDSYKRMTANEKKLAEMREDKTSNVYVMQALENQIKGARMVIAWKLKQKEAEMQITAIAVANEEARVSGLKEQLATQKAIFITSENVGGVTAEILRLEKEMSTATIKKLGAQKLALQSTLSTLDADSEDINVKRQIADINASIAATDAQIAEQKVKQLEPMEQQLKVAQAVYKANASRISIEKEVLGIKQKALQVEQKVFNEVEKGQKLAMQIQNISAGGKGALTPEQEVKLAKDREAHIIANLEKEKNMKVAMIELEYDLLEFRLQVIEAEAKVKGIKGIDFSELRASLATAEESAIAAAGQEGANKALKARLGVLKAEKKAQDKLDADKITAIKNQAAEARLAGDPLGAANLEREAAEERIRQLTRENVTDADQILANAKERLGIEQSLKDTRLGAAGQGATTGDRITSFGKAGGFKEGDSTREKLAATQQMMQPMMDTLASLGPEGELVSAVAQGAFVVADSWAGVGETFAEVQGKAGEGYAKFSAVAGAVAQTISSVASILAASSKARIAAIDKEIAKEKKRDGKSKESLAKISKLEKKKEAEKKKAFETNKKMQMAMVVINTAMAISAAIAAGAQAAALTGGITLPAWVGAFVAIVAVLGAAQLALIAGTSYQGGGGGVSSASTPGSVAAGDRRKSVDLAKSQTPRGELGYMRGERGIGGPERFRPAFSGIKNRAPGGNTGYVVGEQGPELFVPEMPGQIVPNDELEEAAGMTNVNFTINAVDAEGIEDVLVAQRGNIIGMIREAANSYGDTFMEEVDTGVYTPSSVGAARRY